MTIFSKNKDERGKCIINLVIATKDIRNYL